MSEQDEYQCTVANDCRFSGIALHTGLRAHITIRPAPADSGITIVRTDLDGNPSIPALAAYVVDVNRATSLANDGVTVHTVEHVLAALYGCGIDNALIEMDSPEPPIADGSSAPYVALLKGAGVTTQNAVRHRFTVTEPLFIRSGDSRLIMLPADTYRITCTVKFGASMLDTQFLSLEISDTTFDQDISPARTFCLYEEIEPLMRDGLIRGGSLENAVVIKDGAIIARDALRFDDELVRHKILDIVGDLSLIGRRIIGEVIAIKPGHPTNVAMAQKIVAAMSNGEKPIAS